MGIDGGLISGFANLTGGLRADAEQRKQKLISNVTDSVNGLGRIYAEKQAGDAIKQTLVSQLGADPAEVDNVMRQGPQAVAEYAKKKHGEMQAKKALQALGYDTTLGVDQGSPSTSFFQPQTIPDSVRTAVAGGAAPSPTAPAATSTVGGVPTPAGAGAPLPPPPAASPAATPAADPYDAFLRRAAGMTGLDTETLGLAAKFLPPRPKQLDPMYPEELDRIRAQTDEARAAAEAHRRAKEPTPRNIDPLSPEGIEAAAKRRKRELETDKELGAGDFKPPKPDQKDPTGPDRVLPDEVAAAAETIRKLTPGSLRGKTYRDVEVMTPNDKSISDLVKLLTIQLLRTQQANYEGPELRRAMADYNDLVDRSRNIEKANTYTNAAGGVGPAALQADIDAAWKKVEEIRAKPQELPPVPTRGDVGLPPPGGVPADDAPTPDEVKALEAEGKRYDPVTKRIVPIVPINVR